MQTHPRYHARCRCLVFIAVGTVLNFLSTFIAFVGEAPAPKYVTVWVGIVVSFLIIFFFILFFFGCANFLSFAYLSYMMDI